MKNNIIEDFKIYIKENIETFQCSNVVKEGMIYSMISEGKYIRPLLFLTILDEYQIKYNNFFDIAMAIEMMHNYSLIHDDLPALDNDDYRRGKLSSHKKFGEDMAILIGDALLTNSFEMICKNDFIEDSIKIKLIQKFSNYCGLEGMIDGQVKDIINDIKTISDLEEIHIKKTSKLISFVLESAFLITGKKDQDIKKLGESLGLYYQIQDDYLDVYGDDQKIGKTKGKDLKQNKKTYTYFYSKEEIEDILIRKQSEIKKLLPNDMPQTNLIINKIIEREK